MLFRSTTLGGAGSVGKDKSRARWVAVALFALACLGAPATVTAQSLPPASASGSLFETVNHDWFSPQFFQSTLKTLLLLGVLSLAPAVLLMTTSFVRIVVVLGLLRQALGIQQLPSTQVVTSLAMFMSLVIITPVWQQVYQEIGRAHV